MSKLIELTKMDTKKIMINADLIETVEGTHDTVLILRSGRKLIVKETPSEIRDLVNGTKTYEVQ